MKDQPSPSFEETLARLKKLGDANQKLITRLRNSHLVSAETVDKERKNDEPSQS